MTRYTIFAFGWLLFLCAAAQALTVDEIIKLKQAGVADSTIELLINQNAAREKSAGIIRQNGWIIHTTETREPERVAVENYGTAYPIAVYPWAGGFRRR